jgi:NADH-quinone oxidoreductase subunit L
MTSAILVPLLPLLGAIVVAIGTARSQPRRARLALWLIAAAFALSIATLVRASGEGPVTVRVYEPDGAGPGLPVGFYFDRLSSVMMTLIALVGTLIYRYSTNYMYQDRGYGRYLGLIAFTISILLCMVSSANLVMLFVFWQVLSWLLFLLAHNHAHAATLQGACKTFMLLRIGDVAFLAGIVLAHALYGTVEFQELFARAAATPVVLSPLPGIEIGGATAVALLIFIGAMSKSAQFPLHTWLPHFLYAPTPISALLHAGIINAGGFLLNRLAPLYGLSPATLHVVFVVGMVTAALGASMMLVQTDIKMTLGFSTIGQMGYMIMECGMGAFALAVFHLIAHGLFKATAFLNCGEVIHRVRQEPASPHARHAVMQYELQSLTWATGFVTTLVLPFVILLATHGILHSPLLESQGTLVFLFFIWVTSSQAILTLTRLRTVASWKVAVAMLATLILVVSTYLFAAEAFTHFLYPDPEAVAGYFRAAALPGRLFDGLVGGTTLLIVLGWVYLYAQAHGRTMRMPAEVQALRTRLYVLLINRFYIDAHYDRVGRWILRAAHGLAGHSLGRPH